jgi:hypothetical protein
MPHVWAAVVAVAVAAATAATAATAARAAKHPKSHTVAEIRRLDTRYRKMQYYNKINLQ